MAGSPESHNEVLVPQEREESPLRLESSLPKHSVDQRQLVRPPVCGTTVLGLRCLAVAFGSNDVRRHQIRITRSTESRAPHGAPPNR